MPKYTGFTSSHAQIHRFSSLTCKTVYLPPIHVKNSVFASQTRKYTGLPPRLAKDTVLPPRLAKDAVLPPWLSMSLDQTCIPAPTPPPPPPWLPHQPRAAGPRCRTRCQQQGGGSETGHMA